MESHWQVLGRKHQRGFFEKLLGSKDGERFLACVSRSHLQVDAGKCPGSLEVTNLSINPVIVAGLRIDQGCCAVAKPGDTVDFIAGGPPGEAEASARPGEPVVYLRFRVEQGAVAAAAGAAAGLEARTRRGCEEPEEDEAPSARGPFWLMLSGTAVREGLEARRRRVEGSAEGLTVGRAHQTAVHADAFTAEVVQYISRDHFRVERCSDTGEWRLRALTANPIWHVRAGKRLQLTREAPPLKHGGGSCGDSVLLFTGASDKTPDGPGNLGSLRWIFRAAAEQAASPALPSAAGA
ncbi:unnamed protein product [Prorocentrum cordatum]|nr:unnamed protein product [Polarella glacialis]